MVLDIGTGTGLWAVDFGMLHFPLKKLRFHRSIANFGIAEKNLSAVVTGTDLSAIQPDLVPPNVQFQISDAEDEWGRHSEFQTNALLLRSR